MKSLDYPRRAGTEGDEKAADYICKTLERYGLEPRIQEFQFLKSKKRKKLLVPILILAWGILCNTNILFLGSNLILFAFLSIIVLLVPIGLIVVLCRFNWLMKYFSTRKRKKLEDLATRMEKDEAKYKERVMNSRNIIAKLGQPDAEKHVLFTAHHDSISTKCPRKLTIGSLISGGITFLVYSVIYIINLITVFFCMNFMKLHFLVFFAVFLVAFVSFEIFFLGRLSSGNESHGIVDDGTGTAILLELAKFLKDQGMKNYRFIFGFFSAEELGLIGSTHYYINNKFDKDKLHVISIDMIGEKPPLAFTKGINPIKPVPMDAETNARLRSVARHLGIDIKGTNFPYPGSDFAPWLFDGFKVNWLINKSDVIHSRKDKLENVNETLVNDALKLVVGYLIALSK